MKKITTQTKLLIGAICILASLPLIFKINTVVKNYFHYLGFCFLIECLLLNISEFYFKGDMYFFRGSIEYKNSRENRIYRSISLIVSIIVLGWLVWFVYFSK